MLTDEQIEPIGKPDPCPECEKKKRTLEEAWGLASEMQERYHQVVQALCKAVAK